jgi:hypothetical protein
LFVFWYQSPNILDTPHIWNISRLRVHRAQRLYRLPGKTHLSEKLPTITASHIPHAPSTKCRLVTNQNNSTRYEPFNSSFSSVSPYEFCVKSQLLFWISTFSPCSESCVFFWVFPLRQIKFFRRFGTLCQVHLQRL